MAIVAGNIVAVTGRVVSVDNGDGTPNNQLVTIHFDGMVNPVTINQAFATVVADPNLGSQVVALTEAPAS